MEINEDTWDSIKKLHEELKPVSGEAVELAALLEIVKVKFPIGSKVKINLTDYIGIVDSYNERTGGFYPGVRYPIKVQIISTEDVAFNTAIGKVFEYGADQLLLI